MWELVGRICICSDERMNVSSNLGHGVEDV